MEKITLAAITPAAKISVTDRYAIASPAANKKTTGCGILQESFRNRYFFSVTDLKLTVFPQALREELFEPLRNSRGQ